MAGKGLTRGRAGRGGRGWEGNKGDRESMAMARVDWVERVGSPSPGVFADVYQKKGDAGVSVRKYVKRKRMKKFYGKTDEKRREWEEIHQAKFDGAHQIVQ